MRTKARMNGIKPTLRLERWLGVLCFSLFASTAFSQGSIEVDGTVRDKDSNQKLAGVEVSVLQNGQSYDAVRSLSNGKYTLSLDHGADYVLTFTYGDLSVRNV